MSQEFDKIEGIILQIKKESKIVKGGTKNKSRPSRELRNPDLYWKLGSAIKEILEQKNVDDEQKMSWVRKKILPIEEKILGPAKEEFTCEWSYKVVDELQNYEHFIYVANLAGHKFKKFRQKLMDYIFRYYSKKSTTDYSQEETDNLAKTLSVRYYSHKELNSILKQFRSKSDISLNDLEHSYGVLLYEIDSTINSDEKKRKLLREQIGTELITQIRYLLQVLKISNPITFKQTFTSNRSKLMKKIPTKFKSAAMFVKSLQDGIVDERSRKQILKIINPYDMTQMLTKLRAIESEDAYSDYQRTEKTFQTAFE